MADLNDLIKSKKVKEFVRKEKSRPWTVAKNETADHVVQTNNQNTMSPTPLTKPKITKGIRPDKILRGEISFQPLSNVDKTQTERSQEPGHNVARTVAERSHKDSNVDKTQTERSQEPGHNVARTVAERSQEPGHNVAIKNDSNSSNGGNPTLLVGTQRNVFEYLYNLAQTYASLKTPPLTLEAMSSATSLTSGQIHSATKQLRMKECLCISGRKDGRGGWVEYSIPRGAYDAWRTLKLSEERSQNGGRTQPERSQEPGHKPGHPPSSSSSVFINKESTTRPFVDNLVWIESINLNSVEAVGITRSVLIRCRELYKNIQPEELEGLVHRFGEYIRDPKNKVQNPRGFFISLAKQLSEGTKPLEEIETQDEKLLREHVASVKAAKARREALEMEVFELSFDEWLCCLKENERDKLVIPSGFIKQGSPAQGAMLKQYFRDNIWPEQRERIVIVKDKL